MAIEPDILDPQLNTFDGSVGPSRTQVITVTSGKGGVGKTNVVANTAIALAQTKALLEAAPGTSLRAALDAEAMAQTVNFSTKDTREALMAFLEKRTPTYTGH